MVATTARTLLFKKHYSNNNFHSCHQQLL
jgi:hypothetical protein